MCMKKAVALYIMLAYVRVAYTQEAAVKCVQPKAVVEHLGAWIPDSIELHGSTQGMAIKGKYCYMLRDGGQCVVLNMRKHMCAQVYQLPQNTSHCNNANFGPGGHGRSLLYVSECFGNKACYVYSVSRRGAHLVQTLYFNGADAGVAQDWCVDARKACIYAYGGKMGGPMYLKQLPLVGTGSSEVHYNERHVKRHTMLQCVRVAQGSKIYGKYILLPDGNEPGGYYLHVANLSTGEEVCRLNINDIGCEPEGVEVKGRWIYISFHTPQPACNSIYKWNIRQVLHK